MSNPSVSQRIHDQLGQIIANTTPGERLPSEPALAMQFGVSRASLREAMRTFETQGIIQRKQGSGTYVNHLPQVIESGLEVLESIETMANRIGMSIRHTTLEIGRRNASDEECRLLGMTYPAEVTSVKRVMLAKNHPVAYLVDTLPLEILKPEDLKNGFTGSVLDFLMQRGKPALLASRAEIQAAIATSQVARALGIQRGGVLLSFISQLYSQDNKVIDLSHSYFLPGYFRFHVVRKLE